MKGKLLLLSLTGVLILIVGSTVSFAAGPAIVVTKPNTYLEREVRHELLMLPYYTTAYSITSLSGSMAAR